MMMILGFQGFALISELSCSKEVVLTLLLLMGLPLLYRFLWIGVVVGMWWRPQRIRRVFEAQGIKCLPRPFLYGNLPDYVAMGRSARSHPMSEISHDIAPRIMPHFFHWSKLMNGEPFVFWVGSQARYILSEPEQAKDVLSNKFGHFQKPVGRPDTKDLMGNGLGALEGEKWAQHRRIMNPAFYLDKLKAMAPTMAACTVAMMEKWEDRVKREEAIDVSEEFRTLTADIIAHTAFGSSFVEGKQVFKLQHEQGILMAKANSRVYIPGSRFLPTAQNRYRNQINRRIIEVLGQIIERRMKSYNISKGDSFGNDLLGLMMAANRGQLQGTQKHLSMGIDEIIDECKTFFFAGHETTSTLLTWVFFLLASSTEWQERLREEIQEACGQTESPTADSVNHLKLVSMVLNEALRLYPPAVAMFRKADQDRKVGKIIVPAGAIMVVPVLAWHHDKRFWGPDASEFRPDRFSEGIANASTVPGVFLPFSMGPRSCIGQVFAMQEAKIVLCSILQRYRLHLSCEYKHAPTMALTVKPQFGMPIVFEKLQ